MIVPAQELSTTSTEIVSHAQVYLAVQAALEGYAQVYRVPTHRFFSWINKSVVISEIRSTSMGLHAQTAMLLAILALVELTKTVSPVLLATLWIIVRVHVLLLVTPRTESFLTVLNVRIVRLVVRSALVRLFVWFAMKLKTTFWRKIIHALSALSRTRNM